MKTDVSIALKNIVLKKLMNNSYGVKAGEMSIVTSGRSNGKSNSQSMMIEYLKQQIKEVNEYKNMGYTPVYLDSNSATRKEMIEWCKDNCKSPFYVAGPLFMFEDNDDALFFATVW
jgi:hypothetical protein